MAAPIIQDYLTTLGPDSTGAVFTSTFSLDVPLGVQSGELLVAVPYSTVTDFSAQFTAVAGWTMIGQSYIPGGNLAVYYKLSDGTEKSATFETHVFGAWGGTIYRITGFDTAAPVNASYFMGATEYAFSAVHTVTGITTTVNDALDMFFLTQNSASAMTAIATGLTVLESVVNSAASRLCFIHGYRTQAAAGYTPEILVQAPHTDYASWGRIAIAPTVGGGGVTNTVTSVAGVVTENGYAPGVQLTIKSVTGQINAIGYAPQAQAFSLNEALPGVGQAGISGYQPYIGLEATLSPVSGLLTASGYVPLALPVITPQIGSVSTTGYAPDIGPTIRAQAGSVSVAGYAPDIGLTIEIPAGNVSVTGYAPSASIVVPAVSYYDTVITDAPIAYWRLASSTAVHNNEIAATYTAVQSTDAEITAGSSLVNDNTGALDFASAPAHLAIDDMHMGLTSTFRVWSFELWAEMSITANQVLMSMPPNEPGGAGMRLFALQGGDGPVFQWLNTAGATSFIFAAQPLYDQKPHHIVVLRDTLTYRLYLDGVEVDAQGASAGNQTKLLPGKMIIGANSFSTSTGTNAYSTFAYMTGRISDLAIYDKALTAAEIFNHYTTGKIDVVLPDTGSVSTTGYAPSVTVDVNVSPSTGIVTTTGNVAAIGLPNTNTIAPSTGTADLSGLLPSAKSLVEVTASPQLGIVSVSGEVVSVTKTATVEPDPGSAQAKGNAPSLTYGFFVSNQVGAVSVVGLLPLVDTKVWPPLMDQVTGWTEISDNANSWAANSDSSSAWSTATDQSTGWTASVDQSATWS